MLAAVVQVDFDLVGLVASAAAAEYLLTTSLFLPLLRWEDLRVIAHNVGVSDLCGDQMLTLLLIFGFWVRQLSDSLDQDFLLKLHSFDF